MFVFQAVSNPNWDRGWTETQLATHWPKNGIVAKDQESFCKIFAAENGIKFETVNATSFYVIRKRPYSGSRPEGTKIPF